MYAGFGFRRFEIGDVDVVFHDRTFHLFHLVLPNHDYIAHAVSEDGLTWRRVDNALFISNPGNWDVLRGGEMPSKKGRPKKWWRVRP